MSFAKKLKRSVRHVKDSLHIPSQNPTPNSRNSQGISDSAPAILSNTSSSISIVNLEENTVVTTSSIKSPHDIPFRTNQGIALTQTSQSPPIPLIPAERSAGATAWTGLRSFLRLLRQSADVFAPLSSAVGQILKCVDIYERVGQGQEEYRILGQELDALFSQLAQHFDGPASPGITSSICNLAKAIENELRVVETKGRRNAIGRIMEVSVDADEVLKCYRRIQELLQRLAVNANVSIWKIVDEQATEQRLRNLLPSLSARYNSTEATIAGRGGCTPNTRIDVLKILGTWAEDRNGDKIYWFNGMAGTGKTTIAYTLCDRLREVSRLAASFFCSRQLPECRNTSLIFPTIAYQLARFSLPFRYALSKAIERDPDVCAQLLPDQFNALILEPLKAVYNGLPEDLIVIIDALDECDNPESIVPHHQSPRATEPQIHRRMLNRQGERKSFELHLHDLERSVVKEDIKTYLDDELRVMNLPNTDLERFAERSGALFIYAATVVRYLSFENFSRGPDRLHLVLGITVPSLQQNKPKREGTPGSSEDEIDLNGRNEAEIDALYTEILKAAMEDSRLEKRERVERRRVLHTVICAQEPLTVDGIAGLMGLKSSSSVHRALQPLLSVIRVSEESRQVTTLHESFPNHLFDKRRSGDFHCDPAKHNGWLANRCFALMKMVDPPFNICKLESSYVFDDEVEDLEQRVDQCISKELAYVCRHWGAHLVAGDISKRLTDELSEFLQTRFLFWMEVLNLKHSLSLGANMLSKVQAWVQLTGSSNAVRQLAQDSWNFATTYSSSPAARSTPHIYISALAFWPKDRAASKCYMGKINRLVRIGGTAVRLRTSTPLVVCKHEGPVLAVAYSPDGTRIVSGYADGLRVWDSHTGQIIHRLPQDDSTIVFSVGYSPDGSRVVAGLSDETVKIWDAYTAQSIGRPLRGHTDIVRSVGYSADGARIVSGSNDMTVRIWDTQTGQSIGEPLRGHTGTVWSVMYSPDGARIISGSFDSTLRIWDAHTGQMIGKPLQGHTGTVYSIGYSPDGTRIVSGSKDMTVRFWDAHTGQAMGGPLRGHTGDIRSVTYSPGGARIASSSNDGTVRIWDAHTGQFLGNPCRGYISHINSLSYSPNGARIVSGAADSTVRIWDAYTDENTEAPPEAQINQCLSVGYSPDGARIVSGADDMTVRLWDAYTGQAISEPLRGHTKRVCSVVYSPDGTRITSGSDDTTVRIWDARTGESIGEPLCGHTSYVTSVAYSPDSARIVSGSFDCTLRIWDVRTGHLINEPLHGHTSCVTAVAYSHDGTRIVSGSHDMTIRIWDAYTGQTIAEPSRGHTQHVLSVAYSPDSSRIVSSSFDRTIRVWDASTGHIVGRPLEGHSDIVNSVAFSADGARIVSGSNDMTVRLWDTHTGQGIGEPLRGHRGGVLSVAQSPNGSQIVSSSCDLTVRIWETDSEAPDTINGTISSSNAFVMDNAGWLFDKRSNPLIWVPSDLQDVLPCYPNTAIISQRGVLTLDFSEAQIGDLWCNCYLAFASSEPV